MTLETARDILEQCLQGHPPDEIPPALVEDSGGDALFGVLVEGLADRFEPYLCDVYARLFSKAVARVEGGLKPESLVARYNRVRRVRRVENEPRRVFVLSRVTLGADVAVTSVLLAAAKLRFPKAEIVLVGPRKNYELFAGDPRLRHAEVGYIRGGLRERLRAWKRLGEILGAPDSLVIDPDSRLTQLGLLPVCSEERYHLFESRAYGGETDRGLTELAAEWASETLGVAGVKPYVALAETPGKGGHFAVSLGVGENQAKRVPDPFEEELLRLLSMGGAAICIDRGAGGEEAARVEHAVQRSGAKVTFWEGSFAGFASIIASSKFYAGYDSAGQHVASACGIPQLSVFAGFPTPRMFARWRPGGELCRVIRVDRPDPGGVLLDVREALVELGIRSGRAS